MRGGCSDDMKKQIKDLSKEERIKTLDALYTATSSLDTRAQMKAFLRDLLTESERIMLGRRILIAQKLLEGKGWRSIAEEMEVGADTVYRVQQWLLDAFPGYETAIAEMEQAMKSREKKSTLDRLKKKYPLHFLLFNIYDELATDTRPKKMPQKRSQKKK